MSAQTRIAHQGYPSPATPNTQDGESGRNAALDHAIHEAKLARAQADNQRLAYEHTVRVIQDEQRLMRSAVHAQINGLQNLLVVLNEDPRQFPQVGFAPFIYVLPQQQQQQQQQQMFPGATSDQGAPLSTPEQGALSHNPYTQGEHIRDTHQGLEHRAHPAQQQHSGQRGQHDSQQQPQYQAHAQNAPALQHGPSQQGQQHQQQAAPASALQRQPSQPIRQVHSPRIKKAQASARQQAASKVVSPTQEAQKRKAQDEIARRNAETKRRMLQDEEEQLEREGRLQQEAENRQDALDLQEIRDGVELTTAERLEAMPEGMVEMRRDLKTVAEVWQEWHHGLDGGMSVLQMDRAFDDLWRPRNNKGGHHKLYLSRRLIVEEMMVKAEDMGCPPEEMVKMTDASLGKMTLHDLYENIFDEIREEQISRHFRYGRDDRDVSSTGKVNSRIGNIDLVQDQGTRFDWIRNRGF